MEIKTPDAITDAAVSIGRRKSRLNDSVPRLLLLSILAGSYIALGGALSVIIGYGFPEITAGNPAIQRLLSGSVFPIGLILTVILGAELFTGNNALMIPALLRHHYGIRALLTNWGIVWVGNFIGALLFSYILIVATGTMDAEPYRSAITGIASTKASLPWLTVFTRAIGANWCVCLAVWLALAGHSLIEKMAGCWFPVMAFVALGYEHSIANMFFIPTGMMLGADVTITRLIANLIPATLGNIVGGALLVGTISAFLHHHKS